MDRRFAVFGVVICASTLAAQMPPTAAARCRSSGSAYQSAAIQADRAANRTPDVTAIVAEAKRRSHACADSISGVNGTVAELSALSALYIYVGDTTRAAKIVGDLVRHRRDMPLERADVLMAQVQFENAVADPFAGINRKAEEIVRLIDALPDSLIAKKIAAHSAMLGRYEYADNEEGIRNHATTLLALAKRAVATNALPMVPARAAMGNRPAMPAFNPAYISMMSAYSSLARVAGDFLDADAALRILDDADREVTANFPAAKDGFERQRTMYRLVGTPATPIDGKWWINAPDGTVVKPGDAKISIVQFTAHWCVPCKKSYPPMLRLMKKYGNRPVESVMATGIYGFIGDRQHLTPDQEVEADREYFRDHHGLPFQIAINPMNRDTTVKDNDARYAVGGIPEIIIVDRKGVIRATVVGWDQGNEARFAAFIDKLLAEK